MVYGTYNYSIHGGYKPSNINWGSTARINSLSGKPHESRGI